MILLRNCLHKFLFKLFLQVFENRSSSETFSINGKRDQHGRILKLMVGLVILLGAREGTSR